MVGDANPMVVANAVTALMDIHITSQNLLESGMQPSSEAPVLTIIQALRPQRASPKWHGRSIPPF